MHYPCRYIMIMFIVAYAVNANIYIIMYAQMISHLLEKLEFIIVPVANPDGYYVSGVMHVMNTKPI